MAVHGCAVPSAELRSLESCASMRVMGTAPGSPGLHGVQKLRLPSPLGIAVNPGDEIWICTVAATTLLLSCSRKPLWGWVLVWRSYASCAISDPVCTEGV